MGGRRLASARLKAVAQRHRGFQLGTWRRREMAGEDAQLCDSALEIERRGVVASEAEAAAQRSRSRGR